MARLPQEVLDKLANIAVLFEDRRAVMAILVKRLRPIGKIGNRPARFVVITADTGLVELDELLRTQRDLYARREAAGMRHTHGGLEA